MLAIHLTQILSVLKASMKLYCPGPLTACSLMVSPPFNNLSQRLFFEPFYPTDASALLKIYSLIDTLKSH